MTVPGQPGGAAPAGMAWICADLPAAEAEHFRANSTAALALDRACAPQMSARCLGLVKGKATVTLNGQWEGSVPYAAAKGAVPGLTKTGAGELGKHGITVNGIAPGAVRPETKNRALAEKLQEYQDWILKNHCLKARIKAQDVAERAMFLASDAARMITGQNIRVDGGW